MGGPLAGPAPSVRPTQLPHPTGAQCCPGLINPVSLFLASQYINVFPLLVFFKAFSLSLIFHNLNVICLGVYVYVCVCVCVYSFCLEVFEFPRSVALCLLVNHYFKYFFCSFPFLFYFWYSHYAYVTPFSVVPHS